MLPSTIEEWSPRQESNLRLACVLLTESPAPRRLGGECRSGWHSQPWKGCELPLLYGDKMVSVTSRAWRPTDDRHRVLPPVSENRKGEAPEKESCCSTYLLLAVDVGIEPTPSGCPGGHPACRLTGLGASLEGEPGVEPGVACRLSQVSPPPEGGERRARELVFAGLCDQCPPWDNTPMNRPPSFQGAGAGPLPLAPPLRYPKET